MGDRGVGPAPRYQHQNDQLAGPAHNAHPRLKLFTGRNDPAGRDEQYERLYIILLDGNPCNPSYPAYEAGDPDTPQSFDGIITTLVRLAAERNPDFYEEVEGNLPGGRPPGFGPARYRL